MTRRNSRQALLAVTAMVAGFLLPVLSGAQEVTSTSAPLAKELAQLLEQQKLDSIAAKNPEAPDQFVGALYFPGLQLLVVSAKYTAPALLAERIGKREYRDVYIDLNSASIPESKVFIEDLRANGLLPRRDDDEPFDVYEGGGKRTMFDGDWKKQKLSEKEYMDAYVAADKAYARMLSLMIAELKKSS